MALLMRCVFSGHAAAKVYVIVKTKHLVWAFFIYCYPSTCTTHLRIDLCAGNGDCGMYAFILSYPLCSDWKLEK